MASRATEQTKLVNFDRPVRIIFSANNPYLNAGVASDFLALFPNSELFLINGDGHFVQLDKTEIVADLIENFLDEEAQGHENEDHDE